MKLLALLPICLTLLVVPAVAEEELPNFDKLWHYAKPAEIEKRLTDTVPVAQVRYLLERGRTFNSSKKKDEARPWFKKAWAKLKSSWIKEHEPERYARLKKLAEAD